MPTICTLLFLQQLDYNYYGFYTTTSTHYALRFLPWTLCPTAQPKSAATVIAQEFVNLNKSEYLVKTKITAERRRITVWGLAKIPTIFFRIFGVSELVVTVSGQGYPAFGINQEGE